MDRQRTLDGLRNSNIHIYIIEEIRKKLEKMKKLGNKTSMG